MTRAEIVAAYREVEDSHGGLEIIGSEGVRKCILEAADKLGIPEEEVADAVRAWLATEAN